MTKKRSTGAAITLKRVYQKADAEDGARFLVERLWPRGMKKDSLQLTAWLKEAAPSTELRKWFNHDPSKWSQFRRRYFAELETRLDALEPLMQAAANGKVTLVYSSHDEEHNNAVALKGFLESKVSRVRSRIA